MRASRRSGCQSHRGIAAPVNRPRPLRPLPRPSRDRDAPGSVSPVANRVMTPMLPRRLRPIAKVLAFAADVSRRRSRLAAAAVHRGCPEIPSAGLSVVDAQGSVELLYARVAGARAAVLGRGVGSISEWHRRSRRVRSRSGWRTRGRTFRPREPRLSRRCSRRAARPTCRGARIPNPRSPPRRRSPGSSRWSRAHPATARVVGGPVLLVDTAPLVVDLREALVGGPSRRRWVCSSFQSRRSDGTGWIRGRQEQG